MNNLVQLFGKHAATPDVALSETALTAASSRPFPPSLREIAVQMMNEAERHRVKVAVLLMDVRQISGVADVPEPERLEQSIESALRSCLRGSDAVIRYSEHELVILLPRMSSAQDIALTVERIFERATATCRIDEHSVSFSTNVGIAIFPDHGRTADALLDHARSEMELAIANGQNSYRIFGLVTPDQQSPGLRL